LSLNEHKLRILLAIFTNFTSVLQIRCAQAGESVLESAEGNLDAETNQLQNGMRHRSNFLLGQIFLLNRASRSRVPPASAAQTSCKICNVNKAGPKKPFLGENPHPWWKFMVAW
jgi:hypothetical protein